MPANRRTALILGLLIVTLCFFSQPQTSYTQGSGIQKLGPVLGAMKGAGHSDEDLIPVIIQFAEGPPGLLKKEERASERANIASQAGGFIKRAYLNFPFVLAMVDQGTLDRLERHPLISRISYDHGLEGNLYTTARAVGADQAWNGTAGNPGVTGAGVTVAVLDSGFTNSSDLGSGRMLKDATFIGNLDWNVTGLIETADTPPPQANIEVVTNTAYPQLTKDFLLWNLTNNGPDAAVITKVEIIWPEGREN